TSVWRQYHRSLYGSDEGYSSGIIILIGRIYLYRITFKLLQCPLDWQQCINPATNRILTFIKDLPEYSRGHRYTLRFELQITLEPFTGNLRIQRIKFHVSIKIDSHKFCLFCS